MAGLMAPYLAPTYHGHVNSTFDALLLFEACLSGLLPHVPQRPHQCQRPELIRSGNVFIFEEKSSGIKRWTDGHIWSPSRVLGDFLIYRELEDPDPLCKNKRALMKCKLSSREISRPEPVAPGGARLPPVGIPVPAEEQEVVMTSLVGPLVDSFDFKPGGLIKKSISVKVNNATHHLVCYYSAHDVLGNQLRRPSVDDFFEAIFPGDDMLLMQNFREGVGEFITPRDLPFHYHRLISRLRQYEQARLQEYYQGWYQNRPSWSPPEPVMTHDTHHGMQQMQWTYPQIPPQGPFTSFYGGRPEAGTGFHLTTNDYFNQDQGREGGSDGCLENNCHTLIPGHAEQMGTQAVATQWPLFRM